MSVGPVPNLSGGINISPDNQRCCSGLMDGGNGRTFLLPVGVITPDCSCGGGGNNSNNCCNLYVPYRDINPNCCSDNGGGPGNGGNCGSGGGGIYTLFGAGPPASPPCDFACIQEISWAGYCCWLKQQQCLNGGSGNTPNAPYGTFFPKPPAGAFPGVSPLDLGDPQCPPPTTGVPTGALTPPPVQSGGSNFCTGYCVDNTNLGNVLDVPIYCLETGVTFTPISCGSATVAFSVPGGFGSSYHFTAQGGPGYNCSNGDNYTYENASAIISVGASEGIHITRE